MTDLFHADLMSLLLEVRVLIETLVVDTDRHNKKSSLTLLKFLTKLFSAVALMLQSHTVLVAISPLLVLSSMLSSVGHGIGHACF